MTADKSDDHYNPEETARRRDEAIQRALSTPPKPLKEFVGKSVRPPATKRRQKRVEDFDKGQQQAKLLYLPPQPPALNERLDKLAACPLRP